MSNKSADNDQTDAEAEFLKEVCKEIDENGTEENYPDDGKSIRDDIVINNHKHNILFVSRYAPHTGRHEIEEFMGKFGTITKIVLEGEIAFIEYERSEDATAAKESCHSQPGLGSERLMVILEGDEIPDETIIKVRADLEIPQRFIDGCEGDLKEAKRRWDITRQWREAEGVNDILNEPQPHFAVIKDMYPHYHCGRGKDGHVVFYERPGDFKSAQLTALGVKTDQLVRHWLFTTEYQWQVMCGGDETAKGISVIDINKITVSDLAGDNMNYLKKTIAFANAHYPERSHVIFIVNAPFFFSLLWKIVKPLVHENTQKKVKILSGKETLKGLQEHIHISQIPVYYGGECDYGGLDSCRICSPDTLALNEYVKAVNDRHSRKLTADSIRTSENVSQESSSSKN